jgi:hypothetical protein
MRAPFNMINLYFHYYRVYGKIFINIAL